VNFEYPSYLNWLWVLVPLTLFFILDFRWRVTRLLRLGSPSNLQKSLGLFPKYVLIGRYAIRILFISTLIVVLARPKGGLTEAPTSRARTQLVFCLDASRSMLAEDLQPNRFSRAKQAISAVLKRLKGDQVALVVFAGSAHIQLPMTTDYGAAMMFLDAASTEYPSIQGTSISSALKEALKALPENSDGEPAIVLMSDGEDHEGDLPSVLNDLNSRGIRVFAMSIGGQVAAPIPNNGSYLTDAQGKIIFTRPNEDMLAKIASETNGFFVKGNDPSTALNKIMSEIDRLKKSTTLSKEGLLGREELFLPFLWFAFALLCLDLIFVSQWEKWLRKWSIFG
jgi:Ca-activated chloride channel homolog